MVQDKCWAASLTVRVEMNSMFGFHFWWQNCAGARIDQIIGKRLGDASREFVVGYFLAGTNLRIR